MDDAIDLHADLIRRLGGKAQLAVKLNLDRNVLTKWHVRGIPSRYWHQVERIAHEAKIEVTTDDLARTKPVGISSSGLEPNSSKRAA